MVELVVLNVALPCLPTGDNESSYDCLGYGKLASK
jgi:hypothetical protein